MITKTFKRHELKYFVTPDQYKSLQTILTNRMKLDEYCEKTGSYMIYNLYYDTPNDAVIRHSLEKPYYKEKLRLRSYTMPTSGDDTVFLELKKKIGGIVAKRRAIMTYSQATDYLTKGIVPTLPTYEDAQVMREISTFINRNPVIPKVFISYERIAYADKQDPELRISFDFGILTRRSNVTLTDGDWGTELLDNEDYLMEIKCHGNMPFWLCRLLSELKISRTTFSKYGTEFKKNAAVTGMPRLAAIG